jgi:hypothetical protein
MCPFLFRTGEMVAVRDEFRDTSAAASEGAFVDRSASERTAVRGLSRI